MPRGAGWLQLPGPDSNTAVLTCSLSHVVCGRSSLTWLTRFKPSEAPTAEGGTQAQLQGARSNAVLAGASHHRAAPSFVGLTPPAALPGYLLDGVCREGIAPILLALGLDRSQVDVLTSLTVQRPNVRSRPGRRRNAHRLGEVDMLIVRKCGQGHAHTAECHQVRGSGVNYVL